MQEHHLSQGHKRIGLPTGAGIPKPYLEEELHRDAEGAEAPLEGGGLQPDMEAAACAGRAGAHSKLAGAAAAAGSRGTAMHWSLSSAPDAASSSTMSKNGGFTASQTSCAHVNHSL